MWPLAKARINATSMDWANYIPPRPKFIGRRVFKNFDLAELAPFIDWGPFFQTWDLAGPFPAILSDEVVGVEATRVYADAQKMLKHLTESRWLTANGVMALLPANSVGDDIEIYTDESRTEVAMTWYGLRQQLEKTAVDGVMRPSRCLADFVAPRDIATKLIATSASGVCANGLNDSKIADYIGIFAVTAGAGADKKEAAFQANMTTTRPSCSSVSGFYLSHPQASYFSVGKIGDDQLHDLAKRRGARAEDLARLLAPIL